VSFRVRPEVTGDQVRVHAVQREAFGRVEEADLVDALREATQPQLSLVAERDDEVVGHVFFSPVAIEGARDAPASAGLAPLAVTPVEQGRGIGSALVREGLSRCVGLGWRAVFLIGNPAYYGRFGFQLAAPRGLHYESHDYDRGFQLIELEPDVLHGCRGWVRYHQAFAGT
jgi:putative acetyltransferase